MGHPELEQLLQRCPDDQEAWQAYVDVLLDQGGRRIPLIQACEAGEPIQLFVDQNTDWLLGPFANQLSRFFYCTWHRRFWSRAVLGAEFQPGDSYPPMVDGLLPPVMTEMLLSHESARLLTTLELGPGFEGEDVLEVVARFPVREVIIAGHPDSMESLAPLWSNPTL